MGSFLSKFFGVGTQRIFISVSGVEAEGTANVSAGNITNTVVCSFGNSEQRKPQNPLRIYPACSKFFCGRGDVLRQLKESIFHSEKEETSLQRIVAIIGLGGMGKSEIAKVLAKELQSEYEYIFWLDAQTKISLESDLQHLASILKIPWNSNESSLKSVLCDVYQSLAENYKNGILIFDNAEVLKAEQGNFALEKYLLPDFHLKKPVFLVTSRNTMDSECDDIKCVRLNQLSDEESEHCMLSILRIENLSLPLSLKELITSLVKMSEGHPLGLTLIGQGLYYEMESIQLNKTEIESRVRSYIKLLKDSGLKDIPGQSNYEENLQVITDLTIEKLLKKDKGKIAVELLNIVALLSPDNINVGLVNGIYCEKPFETHKVLCPQFVEDDLEITVRSGLKLLLSSSLLKIESKAYEECGYQYKYNLIKIHRLIQQSAQNRLIRQNKTMEPLEKILRFTERSRLNRDHVNFLLQFFLRNRLAYLHPETCSLQILGMHLEAYTGFIRQESMDKEHFTLLDQVRDVLRTKKEEFHSDCSKALCLFEICLHENINTFGKDHLDQLERSIEELSPEFSKQRWLLWLIMLILDKFQQPGRWLPQGSQRWANLVQWVVKHYTDVKDDSSRNLTEFVSNHGYYRTEIGNYYWSLEREFFLKLFDSTSEGGRGDFWFRTFLINSRFLEEQRGSEALAQLTFSGTNYFSRSLQFSHDAFKYWFIINIDGFVDCVELVAQYPELRASLLATEGFVSSLWDLTEFGFRTLSTSWEYMNNVWDTSSFVDIIGGLGRLLDVWCILFAHNVGLYRSFGEKLDAEVEDLLGCPWDQKSIYKLSYQLLGYEWKIESLAAEEHCSPRTRNWIQKLLEYKKQWDWK